MPYQNLNRFQDHTVVITGSAHGIGRACMHRFSNEGATVIGLDIDANANNQLVAELNASFTNECAMGFDCNVSHEHEVTKTFKAILEKWPHIDTLICSAGVYSGQPLSQVASSDWEAVLATNLNGIFYCNRAVSRVMEQQQSGSMINISSMAGKTSFPGTAQYSASKSGIIGLTRSVAMELAPFGVTANTLCPGNTDTRMLHQVADVVSAQLGTTPSQWLQQRKNDCPMGRFADPDEIAGVAAFLASRDARYLTGQAIEVDGGMVLS